MDKPVRVASVVILVVVIAGAIVSNRELLLENFAQPGRHHRALLRAEPRASATSCRDCCGSAPASRSRARSRSASTTRRSRSCIAQTVIGSVEMSLPAAVYGVLMFFVALGFGFLIRRRGPAQRADAAADACPTARAARGSLRAEP